MNPTLISMTCPACGADLATPPVRDGRGSWRLPSLRLEIVEAAQGRPREWQLSTFPEPGRAPLVQGSSGFDPDAVRAVYHLCGDGHVFKAEEGRAQPNPAEWTIQHWNMLAAVGSVASGKSYLLVRTLAQRLRYRAFRDPASRNAARYGTRTPDPVEDIPGDLLRAAYERTRDERIPMGPTTLDELLPASMLEQVGYGLTAAVQRIHRDLFRLDDSVPVPWIVGGWGQRIRQPVVLRTELIVGGAGSGPDRIVWTGVSDLAGESMARARIEDRDQEALLRRLDGLIWVVDPAVNARLTALVEKAVHSQQRQGQFIEASIRMDPGVDVRGTQTRRESRQAGVGTQLTRKDGPMRRAGGRSRLLVVVNKADLIRTALTAGDFDEISAHPGDMREGVERYLHHALERSAPSCPADRVRLRPARDLAWVLDRMRTPDPAECDRLVRQLADGLVAYYSNADRFWELVHEGENPATIRLAAGSDHQVPEVPITVPSLDQHLISALQPGAGSLTQVRDLVMSAIGCGLMYALGHREQIDDLLLEPTVDLHLFVCSPLEHVPTQSESGSAGFAPLNTAANFPLCEATSAALSQLLLAIQYGARS